MCGGPAVISWWLAKNASNQINSCPAGLFSDKGRQVSLIGDIGFFIIIENG